MHTTEAGMPLFYFKERSEGDCLREKKEKKMEALRKRDTYETFKTYEEMEKLLVEMDQTDQWPVVNMARMRVSYVKEGTAPIYIYKGATQEQVDAAYAAGTMTLQIGSDHYLMNPTALLTLGQTTETCCRLLSKFIRKGHLDQAAELYNKGLSYLSKENRILVRGQQVMAFFSKNYCVLDQKLVFERSRALLLARFPGARFIKGSYTPVESSMLYELCGSEHQIFQKYIDAWKSSGFDEDDLKSAKIFVRIATGDTGEATYKVSPLIFAKGWIPLGEPEKIKHYGKNTVNDIDDVIAKIFANLENGMNKLADMMDIDITHPVICMEKMIKQIGLEKICPTIVTMLKNSVELLEIVRAGDPADNRITAFTLYQTLLDAQYYPAFQKLEKQTKLKAWESFFRAAAIDWDKIN